MIEWLKIMIQGFISRLMPPPPDPNAEKHPPCPVCGEEWDEGEIFCYLCGYQESDEEHPIHPRPVRDGFIVDPGNFAGQQVKEMISEGLSGMSWTDKFDMAIFIVSRGIRKKMSVNVGRMAADSLDGIGYCLYNSWRMGVDRDQKGILILIDPMSDDRVLVTGKNGPSISGAKFRDMYKKYDESIENKYLDSELEFIAMNIGSLFS